uniref:Hypothetical homing endonuclease n=1 Tax=Ourococcus multisporus TaxID=132186 RepID=A0A076VF66_9CHLO|nr:hypothetical homing endonuclease [Ourococcus multisporus]AIK29183.1 hypothetical homing endonuclease [Ourococcus multisporus]
MFFLNGQSAREGSTLLVQKEQNRCFLQNQVFAWFCTNQSSPKLALNLRQMPSLQRLNVGHPDNFINWFCGLIDGDGNFYFTQSQKGSWTFVFKVSQPNYNLKLLTYLKKKLKCGSVKKAGKKASQYYIKNPEVLFYYLLPKFPAHAFLTRKKAWQFSCFQKALDIYMQGKTNKISVHERNLFLKNLQQQSKEVPLDFKVQHPNKCKNYPSLGWLIGFTEAEGSFYLNLKKEKCLVHGVSWGQKDEKELLEAIRFKLNIQVKVSLSKKNQFFWYKLSTTSIQTIEKLVPLFEKKIKGIKAVEVRKWARSFRKDRGNYEALKKLQYNLRQAKKHTS